VPTVRGPARWRSGLGWIGVLTILVGGAAHQSLKRKRGSGVNAVCIGILATV